MWISGTYIYIRYLTTTCDYFHRTCFNCYLKHFDIWECIWEKGPIGNFLCHKIWREMWYMLHKFDCRETTLSNAANHFKIFLVELEICVYKHLYFLYVRNPLIPILVFIPVLQQLKVNMFDQKEIVFQSYTTSKCAITFDRSACSTHCLQCW